MIQIRASCCNWNLQLPLTPGGPFVKATYHPEGGGCLAFESYESIATVQASMHKNRHPNVSGVTRQLSAGNFLAMDQMVQYALSCIQPGLQYFITQLGHSLREPLAAFKAARLLNPQKVAEMLPTASDVDDVASFPFVTSAVLSDLKAKLPSHVAKADGIDPTFAISGGGKTSLPPLVSISSPSPAGAALLLSL